MNYDINEFEENYNSPENIKKGEEEVEERLWNKVEKEGSKINFAKEIKALYRYMRDSCVPWYRKSIVIGALIYFISPLDAIPDIAPFIGYLDDLGVIMAVIKFLGSEIVPYYD